MKLGKWLKFQKLHICSLSTPGGWNWAYFCSTGIRFRDMGQVSKLPYSGMKLGKWKKFQKLYIYDLNYSWVEDFTPFCSTIARFPDNWGFWFLHRVQWWIWNFRKKNRFKSERQNFKNKNRSFVRTIEEKIQGKFGSFRLRFVCLGGVAFWNFRSHRVSY